MVLVAQPKRRSTIQHKKRSGQHHKQSKHYAKPYWPYLPLLAIVGIGIIVNSTWSTHAHGVLGYATDVSTTQLLDDTNAQRQADHERSLQLNNDLTEAAQTKANDMAKRNYWSHDTPDGRTPWTFISNAGYQFQAAGENLAYGFNSSNAITNGWMNSAEHRANILNKVFTDVGFGIANAPDYQGSGPETIVVAMYGQPENIATHAVAYSSTLEATTRPAAVVSEPQATKTSRIQTLTTNESMDMLVISVITTLAILFFILRHGLFLHRALVKSEVFVVHHPMLDVLLVTLAPITIASSQFGGASVQNCRVR